MTFSCHTWCFTIQSQSRFAKKFVVNFQNNHAHLEIVRMIFLSLEINSTKSL
jgi:hypothetical protein